MLERGTLQGDRASGRWRVSVRSVMEARQATLERLGVSASELTTSEQEELGRLRAEVVALQEEVNRLRSTEVAMRAAMQSLLVAQSATHDAITQLVADDAAWIQ